MSINELAKKIKEKHGIPTQTINNFHSELRITNIAHIVAITDVLRVPLERLSCENVESAKYSDGYDDLHAHLEKNAKVYNKAHGLSMTFDIYRTNTEIVCKLMCSVGSLLDNVYPEKHKPHTSNTVDVYNVIGGNISPSNSTLIDNEEIFYNRPSIYEYINSFSKVDNGIEEYNRLLKLFSAYRNVRYSLGATGKLSPFAFYLLNYEVGRLFKWYNER